QGSCPAITGCTPLRPMPRRSTVVGSPSASIPSSTAIGCADRVLGPLRPHPADEDAVARSPRRPVTHLPRDCPHLPNRPCSEPRTARLDSLRTGTTVCLRTRAGGITSARSQLLLS